MVDDKTVGLIRCPKTHQHVKIASKELLEQVQRLLASGELRPVNDPPTMRLESGFVTSDNHWFYPVWDGIPALIDEEAMDISDLFSGDESR